MNQDHVVAGSAALTGATALPIVLQHFQGLDPTTASAEATAIMHLAYRDDLA